MADFCAIRPANDTETVELASWCALVFPAIRSSGHSLVKDLYATRATRRAAGTAMTGMRCVLFFGHGTDTELLGAQDKALVDSLNIGNASGAIVIAIACSSGTALGPLAIQKGVESYLGFDGLFVWLSRDPDGVFQPAITDGIERLITGGDIDDVRQLIYDGLEAVIDYYQNGAGSGTTNSTNGWLTAFWSQRHLVLHGYTAARL